MMEYAPRLKKYLDEAIDKYASDLLISVNHPPALRITGQLTSIEKERNITPEDAKGLAFQLMTEDQKKFY